jgi:pimeloyl-ACP methyl ester carboxylesterase
MTTHTLTMPRLGETMEEGRVVGWLVAEGGGFKRGEAIIEIETDKTVVEYPALGDGRLTHKLVHEGDHVVVGAPLAEIEIGAAADWPDIFGEEKAAAPTAAAVVAKANAEASAGAATAALAPEGRPRATPLARRLARQNGIDIATLTGSGRRGRVEKADVLAALGESRSNEALPVVAKDVSFIDLASGRLAYVASGPADGSPVLLIHGFAADHTAWAAVATQLARSGRRVIAVDLPGHGATTLSATRVSDLGAPLAVALDTLPANGPFAIIAHSLGVAAAVALAEARPERVASLTLVAPAGLGLEIDAAFVRGIATATSAGEVAHLLRRLSATGVGLSPAALADVAREMAKGRLGALAEDVVGPLGQRIDILPAIGKLSRTMPLRVIFGLQDRIIPWSQVTALPPTVAIHLMAGSGHMPHWDELRPFLAIIGGERDG